MAITVNEDGCREVHKAAEETIENRASWNSSLQRLKGRGLDMVKLIVGGKRPRIPETVREVFPDAKYQRCVVHLYRNMFSVVPKSNVQQVALILKAVHTQESNTVSWEKARAVAAVPKAVKLPRQPKS